LWAGARYIEANQRRGRPQGHSEARVLPTASRSRIANRMRSIITSPRNDLRTVDGGALDTAAEADPLAIATRLRFEAAA
jgi:hypothetical protein